MHHAALTSVEESLNDPSLYFDVNITGMACLLAAAAENKTKHFIYASSSSVYGNNLSSPQKESDTVESISPYALTEQVNEQMATLYTQLYGLSTLGLRYFNVYGPGQDSASMYAAVIPKFIDAALKDEHIYIYGDGEQTRDFIYVRDVALANLAASKDLDLNCHVLNIGSGQPVSINKLFNIIASLIKLFKKTNYSPPRKGEVRDSFADIRNAEAMLHWNSVTTLEEGLHNVIDWYRRQ